MDKFFLSPNLPVHFFRCSVELCVTVAAGLW